MNADIGLEYHFGFFSIASIVAVAVVVRKQSLGWSGSRTHCWIRPRDFQNATNALVDIRNRSCCFVVAAVVASV